MVQYYLPTTAQTMTTLTDNMSTLFKGLEGALQIA